MARCQHPSHRRMHEVFLVCLVADLGRSAQQVDQFVREGGVQLAGGEAGPQGDQAGGEIHFGESHIGDATAQCDVLRVTEQHVEQLDERRIVVHAATIGRMADGRYGLVHT